MNLSSRIEIYCLPDNHGPAYARNVALKHVQGKYVAFLDSDDWLDSDALEKAVEVFEKFPNTDTVLFDVEYVYNDIQQNHHYLMKPFDVKSGQEAFLDSLTWKIHGWYAVKANLHALYPYDDSCRTYSDDNTTRLHYLNSREVRCCSGIYHYYQNPKSITHVVSVSRYDYLLANQSMKRQLLRLNLPNRVMKIYENVMWLNIIDLYMFYFCNRKRMSDVDNEYGLDIIKASWKQIEVNQISTRYKFGYVPIRSSWFCFRVQEEIYFFLKKILHLM